MSKRIIVLLHCAALFIILVYGLYHVINEIELLGYLLLTSSCLLSISLYCVYKNNFSTLLLKTLTLMTTLVIVVTCYFLGMRGIIFVFPLVTAFFYSFPYKVAVITAIIVSACSLLASLNTVEIQTVLRLSIALAINILFITCIAHLVYKQQMGLVKEAREDQLTGIANRRYFNELLSLALTEAKISDTLVVLLYLDLDDFKAVNDTYGHCIGDGVLKEASTRLQSCIREADAVCQLDHLETKEHVARLGGDEFAIILKDVVCISEINEVTERILAKMNEPYIIDKLSLYCHASVGMAWNKDKTSSPELLMQQADSAMYQAKEKGKQSCHTFNYTTH
ncbi:MULTISPECIES: GGDEF domain-containing protein [unclassified Colwellia]|uniref:GGDEF domain-containing protein n=1 Tax=unclassified Colwellia TaxID=196834 RepID=UPI0015F70F95|nr:MULTISPECIES: GGDEF domain-containing protein [unclassified Colwellia]MBA6352433.1 GGDEF domain-containing protein [Colwellia sp. BRX9-1]MBA6356443.1 GGDEF domain-containing protein [Colwellia sp. BRX8-3]MBA6360793.1 GGDEF domain-containing protein [Colwellia sp. BRX8-6]MBA6368647.1 GGDEF domain-containing protein [Colwellia sp. BRX8-5]MBA6375229.1 GGDEF domain-containing protein [Colwellia sp. BRX8-2]